MVYIDSDVSVSRTNKQMAKGIIMEMCCDTETTSLTLITNGGAKYLHADDATTVYNMCVFTAAIEDALDIDGVAIVIATHGLASNKTRVLVVLPLVNES